MGKQRVVVAGGGVVGLCCAYWLRRAGAEVTVLDSGTAGSGSSHGNAGWIVPSLAGPLPAPGLVKLTARSMLRPDSPVYIRPRADGELAGWLYTFWRRCNERDYLAGMHATARLAERTMELYDALAQDGVRFEMHSDGLLFAFLSESHALETLDGLRPMTEHGYRLPDKPMATADLLAFEPALSPAVAAGFHVSEERHVEPASLVEGLVARLRQMGVEVREGSAVGAFERRGLRVSAVITTDARIETDDVVLAAGAWTTDLARRLGVRMPMQAGKGYSFSVRPAVAPKRPLYLSEAKIGCTPFADGRLRVAGTMELSGLNTRLDRRRVDAMIRGARPFLTGWDAATFGEEWTGMRPVPSDGQPIIGRAGPENVYLATGHSMLGVTLAPATGEAVARMVTTGRTPDELAPFALDRRTLR